MDADPSLDFDLDIDTLIQFKRKNYNIMSYVRNPPTYQPTRTPTDVPLFVKKIDINISQMSGLT